MGTRKGRLIKMFTPLLNNFINTKLIFIYFFLFFSFWCHFYELFLYEKLFYMFSLTWENLPYFLVFLPQYLIPVSFYFFYEVGSPVYIFFYFFWRHLSFVWLMFYWRYVLLNIISDSRLVHYKSSCFWSSAQSMYLRYIIYFIFINSNKYIFYFSSTLSLSHNSL